MKTTKKTSPKKGNPLEISAKYALKFEYHEKEILINKSAWNRNLHSIQELIQKWDRMLQEKEVFSLSETQKTMELNQRLLAKTAKAIEQAHKESAKLQDDYESKCANPFVEGQFANQGPESIESVRSQLSAIQAVIERSRACLGECSAHVQRQQQDFERLTARFNTLFLGDQLKAVSKQETALCEDLKRIHESMQMIREQHSPRTTQSLLAPHRHALLQLSEAHRIEDGLFKAIQELSVTEEGLVPSASKDLPASSRPGV